MITKTNCECCDEQTYHIELDKEFVSFDGETLSYSLTRDELQFLYISLKEELLYN